MVKHMKVFYNKLEELALSEIINQIEIMTRILQDKPQNFACLILYERVNAARTFVAGFQGALECTKLQTLT